MSSLLQTILLDFASPAVLAAIVSGAMNARHDRKQRQKNLQWQQLEKALALLRKDYLERRTSAENVMGVERKPAVPSTVAKEDLWAAVVMCSSEFEDDLEGYLGVRDRLAAAVGMLPSERDFEVYSAGRRNVQEAGAEFERLHRQLLNKLTALRRQIAGVK